MTGAEFVQGAVVSFVGLDDAGASIWRVDNDMERASWDVYASSADEASELVAQCVDAEIARLNR